MIKVGFIVPAGDQGWLGGVSYYRNLLSAVRALESRSIEPVLLTSAEGTGRWRSEFPGASVVEFALENQSVAARRVRRGVQMLLGRDIVLERALRRHGIDILSHSGYLGHRSSIPSIAWIPDLQEKSFPSFFSAVELKARARNIRSACRSATTVVLSSHHTKKDLEAVAPERNTRLEVLQFVAAVPRRQDLPKWPELQAKYSLPERYFHLPNQFWVHKNHELVVRALGLLRQSGRSLHVVATGDTHDHRRPAHFSVVMNLARELDVADTFRVLGRVPYNDLMGLMSHAVAVINPSRFEGWSTTVEEAKSMGKAVVLSDIAVHREQAPDRAVFFDPDDAESASVALESTWDRWQPSDDAVVMDAAAEALQSRRHAFAQRFQEIVEATLAHHRRLHAGTASVAKTATS